MGTVRQILSAGTVPDRLLADRLAIDLADNIHIHLRDLRLEFSAAEYRQVADLLSRVSGHLDQYEEGGTGHQQYAEMIRPAPVYGGGRDGPDGPPDPTRMRVEEQAEGHLHLHYADLRIELSTDGFEKLAGLIRTAQLRRLCGEQIGRGTHRTVYANRSNTGLVIKVASGLPGSLAQNRAEWDVWERATPEIRRWLAPCVEISVDDMIVVQQRGSPVDRLPYPRSQLPRVLQFRDADLAYQWVRIGDRVCLCDYGRGVLAAERTGRK